jgi:hypothetical protein
MGSKAGKLLGTIAPIAASFIPGIGPLAGAAIGAGGGLLSGGGLKGALLGAATGGLAAGGGSQLASAAGLTGAGAKAAAGALTGGSQGLYQGGGLKGALLGSALGGAGGYALGGGFDGALDKLGIGPIGGAGAEGSLMNHQLPGVKGISLAGEGSGMGGLTKLAAPLSTVFSGVQSSMAQDEMKKELLNAQGKSEAALQPFLDQKFEPGDLQNDPGYQFNLQQGEQALDRKNAASGGFYSGGALKEAANFGSGLAENTYGNAYTRWLQNQQSKMAAAGAATNVYDNQGNIAANNTLGKSNILNGTLSSLLSGSGAKKPVGYKSDGTPIYPNDDYSWLFNQGAA